MSWSAFVDYFGATAAVIFSLIFVIRIIYFVIKAIVSPRYPQTWTKGDKIKYHFGEAIFAVLTITIWSMAIGELRPLITRFLSGEDVIGPIRDVVIFGVCIPALCWMIYESARRNPPFRIRDFVLPLLYLIAKLTGNFH